MGASSAARTYNQNHISRKYTPGKRRMSIYWTWSYPWESQRDLAEMDNRFSTMTEVRRVAWPAYEKPEWSAAQFLQGIAGTLELFHRSTLSFQEVAEDVTGHPVAVFQRIDQAGYRLPIDKRILADTDTLMVFGLDHLVSEQTAGPEEDRSHRRLASNAKTHASSWPRITTLASQAISSSVRWNTSITAMRWCRASSASGNTPLAHERARRAGAQSLRAAPGACPRHEGHRAADRV